MPVSAAAVERLPTWFLGAPAFPLSATAAIPPVCLSFCLSSHLSIAVTLAVNQAVGPFLFYTFLLTHLKSPLFSE